MPLFTFMHGLDETLGSQMGMNVDAAHLYLTVVRRITYKLRRYYPFQNVTTKYVVHCRRKSQESQVNLAQKRQSRVPSN